MFIREWSATAVVLGASLMLVTSSGCAGGNLFVHRLHPEPAQESLGRVRVIDGVLRGGSLNIPVEGLTLEEAVARSLRAGARLAPSNYGGDIPAANDDNHMSQAGQMEQWYVLLHRAGKANIIPASLVQFSPIGSTPLVDRDMVSVVSAAPFQSGKESNIQDTTLDPNSPDLPVVKVLVASLGSGNESRAEVIDQAADTVASIFDDRVGGYVAVYREVAGVRGMFILRAQDKQFMLGTDDLVHWVHPDALHVGIAGSAAERGGPHKRFCRVKSGDAFPGDGQGNLRQQAAVPLRAASRFLRLPGVF